MLFNMKRIFTVIFIFALTCSLFAQNSKKDMKEALIIIDIQNDYFEGGANPLENSLLASLNAKMLLEYFRKNNLPIVHIQHIANREGATFFVPNTKGVEIHENVKPIAGEKVITKHYPNSFRETELQSYLQSLHIDTLVICGMMTSMCVDATTRAAKDLGYECIVIGNACAAPNLTINDEAVKAEDVHNAFLAALNYYYSTVLTADQYLR